MVKPERAGQAIAKTGKRGAERQHQRRAKLFRNEARGNLQARHGADEYAAQNPERRIIETEFGLPQRQHDVDEVGVAVVQRVRHRRDRSDPSLIRRKLPCQCRKILPMKPACRHWQILVAFA
jgi:hypothetical protein